MNKTAAAFFATTLVTSPYAWGHDCDGHGHGHDNDHGHGHDHDDDDDNDGDDDDDDDDDDDNDNGEDDSPPAVPDLIAVPAGYEVQAHFSASGDQIYTCAASPTAPGTYLWTFVAPSATLYDEDGDVAAQHYAGPTWEANDGSKVVGTVLAKSPAPDGTSIAWLLLSAATVADPGDTFEGVAYVQRLDTGGGSAPATGCSSANVSAQLNVPYTAEYWFYALD